MSKLSPRQFRTCVGGWPMACFRAFTFLMIIRECLSCSSTMFSPPAVRSRQGSPGISRNGLHSSTPMYEYLQCHPCMPVARLRSMVVTLCSSDAAQWSAQRGTPHGNQPVRVSLVMVPHLHVTPRCPPECAGSPRRPLLIVSLRAPRLCPVSVNRVFFSQGARCCGSGSSFSWQGWQRFSSR